MVDIKYSQNFFTNQTLLRGMVERANISLTDTVLDIGAGNGTITRELCKYSDHVIAYEYDNKYFKELERNLSDNPSVILENKNFLTSGLPTKGFKVFSNIPFASTTDIISKLTEKDSALLEAYLFVQEEAAMRFVGEPVTTQIATILNARYNISIVKELDRGDFNPVPGVDIVLLKISKKVSQEKEFGLYRDFVTYIFNQMNKSVVDTFEKIFTEKQMVYIKKYLKENYSERPSEIKKDYYLELFKYFKLNGEKYRGRVQNYYQRYMQQHSKREKVNRTRS
jgi:23S rRNA (adenine-N6)-dimethyltransferase